MAETWLVCSACRSDIPFGGKYFQCSVSTCNRARTRLVFCSVSCWDSHVATLRHRDAWAEDKIAPTKAAWERELASDSSARPAPPPPRPTPSAPITRPAVPAPAASSPAISAAAGSATAASDATRAAASSAMGRPPGAPSVEVSTPPSSHHTSPATSTSAAAAPTAVRRVVGEPAPASGVQLNDVADRDILIVVSKLKKYIKDRSGMNCSDAVAEILSDHVRALADDSIRAAGRDERKTVLDRDVPRPRR